MSALPPSTIAIALLALHASLLALLTGMVVTALCSLNTMLSLVRDVLIDIRSSCVEFDAAFDALLDEEAREERLAALRLSHAERVAQKRTPDADLRGALGGTKTSASR